MAASLTRFKGVRTHMQTLQVMERFLELSATPGGGVPSRRAGASGHSTISTTVDLYSHVTETMQADAAARLTRRSGLPKPASKPKNSAVR
jgi:hypothetical protein